MDAYCDRDNVAQVVLLEAIGEEKNKLCVANTHILFNDKRGLIKLSQIRRVLDLVENVLCDYQAQDASICN